MANLRRDVILIGVGAFLSIAFQALNDLTKALAYPSLFFPVGANLMQYNETEAILFVAFAFAAVMFVRGAENE